MPFASNAELPARVRDNIPSTTGKDLFRQVVNQQMERGRSESVAFASAWAALENAGFERNSEGKWVKKHLARKRKLNDDIFTTRPEARARATELGLDDIHVHEIADGQAVFMPGESHEAYLRAVASQGSQEPVNVSHGIIGALREMRDLLFGKAESQNEPVMAADDGEIEQIGAILKVDDEQRIVWGWASVISENGQPVVDTQGDVIAPDEMEKAANAFMEDVRMAKAMHDGDGVGEVIHSLPLTKALGDALGLQADREGWIIAMKIHDDDIWARVKAGELAAFSIGGQANRTEAIDAEATD